MVPVMVATCTTIIVLAPLALMPGMGGFLFKPLALAVAFAMVASFLLSRTFVPMMCANFLGEEQGHGGHGHAVGEHGDGHGHAAPSGGCSGPSTTASSASWTGSRTATRRLWTGR